MTTQSATSTIAQTTFQIRHDHHVSVLQLVLLSFASSNLMAEPIYFEEAVMPILRQSCIACHHAKKAEGGLNLESFASLSRGGDSGVVIDPNQASSSLLLARTMGDAKTIMPPRENKVDAKELSEDQVAILKQWIETGALSKATMPNSSVSFQPLPEQVQATYALAVTPDANWLVFSRGNDLVFQSVDDWSKLVGSRTEPILLKDVHRDCCYAIAISPDGQRVASGSSGEVKLWRRRVARRMPSEAMTPMPQTEAASIDKTKTEGPISSNGKRLTLDGTAIARLIASQDGSVVASLDEQHRLRLWNAQTASIAQEHLVDPFQSILIKRIEHDVDRQKRRLDRWNAKSVELKKTAEKEGKTVEEAKQAHEVAVREWEAKKQELQPLVAAIPDLEKSIGRIQAALESAKQQTIDLTERQKQENADIAKLQLALVGTQVLVELGNQKLAELTPLLEQKKKASSELQPQEVAAKAKADVAFQNFKQSEESVRLANLEVEKKQSLLTQEQNILNTLQSELERQIKEKADLFVTSTAICFTGNGQHLVGINTLNQLEIYGTKPLQRNALPIPLTGNFNRIQPIGEHQIVLSGPDQIVERWLIEPFWELECSIIPSMQEIVSDRVNALAFNHDGNQLAIGSGNGSRTGHLAIVDLGSIQPASFQPSATRIILNEPEWHSDTILGLAYSPDGRWLATCSADKMTKIVDSESHKLVLNLEGHTHHVLGVAWQDDGQFLSTTSGDGTIKVWDSETGEVSRTLSVGKELTALSFVGNSTRFASAAIDNSVRLHDIQSNDQIRQFTGAQNALYAIAISPDGRFVISGGQEGTPQIWQIEDGKQLK